MLRLGTRKSLLAMTQSTWVKREIEKRNPGVTIELIPIDTKGDQILDKPLQQVAGKDFFVAELDQALMRGEIDFTVHSLKDLSLTRPDEIAQAAIPVREAQHDVLIFSTDSIERARAGLPIRIGTSSPRRLENLPLFLKDHFVSVGRPVTFEWNQIRGNVNTRIKRLADTDPTKKLEGVCLALAGINRLWNDESSRKELSAIFKQVGLAHLVILPLGPCPTAPGQGALSVECLAARADLLQIIGTIHDETAAQSVDIERKILAQSGGGCHSRFGATQLSVESLGALTLIAGKLTPESTTHIDEVRWSAPAATAHSTATPWNGSQFKPDVSPLKDQAGLAAALETALTGRDWVLLTHPQVIKHLPDAAINLLQTKRLVTSGLSTWRAAAARGLWITASSESFGPEWIEPYLTRSFTRAPLFSHPNGWVVLTFDEAVSNWAATHPEVKTVALYSSTYSAAILGKIPDAVASATHFFWTSPHQYQSFKKWVPKKAHHASGAGRTWDFLKKEGLDVTAFPSAKDWENWLS